MARKYKAATAKEVQAYNLGRIAYHDGVEDCPHESAADGLVFPAP